MTEAEWLAGEDPRATLEFVRGGATPRKIRLFVCGCCAVMWGKPSPGELAHRVIGVGERVADGIAWISEATEPIWDELIVAQQRAMDAGEPLKALRLLHYLGSCLSNDPLPPFISGNPTSFRDNMLRRSRRFIRWLRGTQSVPDAGRRGHEATWLPSIRDIFGNPFRPVIFSPSWHTSTAVAIASQMYESRDFGAMPILADALQDTGCIDEAILTHCRGPGPHVRGCWVTDALLNKP